MNIYMLIAMGILFFIIKKKTDGKLEDATEEHWPTLEPLPAEEEAPVEMEEEKTRKLQQLIELLGAPAAPKNKPETAKSPEQPKKTEAAPPTKVTTKAAKSPSANTAKPSVGQTLRSSQGARRAFIYSEIFQRKYE